MPTSHRSDLPTAESETVGFLVSLKYNVATVSTHSIFQLSQPAPCYSSTNIIAALGPNVPSANQNTPALNGIKVTSWRKTNILEVFKAELDGSWSNLVYWKVSLHLAEGWN